MIQDAAVECAVTVSPGGLVAWITVTRGSAQALAALSRADVLRALNAESIEVTRAVELRITRFLEHVHHAAAGDADLPAEPFPIAVGREPVEPVDGRFEWDAELLARFEAAPLDTLSESPYERSAVLALRAGQRVGRCTSPSDGQVGRDVRGKPLLPARPRGSAARLPDGLRVREGSDALVEAERPCCLWRREGRLTLCTSLVVPHDLDFRVGALDVEVDVTIQGNVNPNFNIRTTGSVRIAGTLDGADVLAGRDVAVRGGIAGKALSNGVQAGGTVEARYCDGARIQAKGDLHVGGEILNCAVEIAGGVHVETGAIIGGCVCAGGGVRAGSLGSPAGVRTRIVVGERAALRGRAKHRPQNGRTSTANNSIRGPAIYVAGELHPGCELQIGRRMARIRANFRGPLRIEASSNGRRLLMIDDRTNFTRELFSTEADLPRFPELGRTPEAGQSADRGSSATGAAAIPAAGPGGGRVQSNGSVSLAASASTRWTRPRSQADSART